MDKIFINDLIAWGIIGVNEDERMRPQKLILNIIAELDLSQVCRTDNIEDTVSYSVISKKILAYIENSCRYTLEALAADLAHLCLDEPKVVKVHVRIEKPGAILFAHSAGVEIIRTRNDSRT